MLQSAAPRRDRAAAAAADADAAERLRAVRERLEATVCGLGELELLRRRQEVLVRAALGEEEEEEDEEEEEERHREAQLSSEEKLLEENILLLRKQLNCLRRRDAGLITQLQELDRQISDLRLDDAESHDLLEPDSRPSSGFYELSDGASGSLSNSSNSVFSECFCPTADADGRLPPADELAGCLNCDGLLGGLCDNWSSSGTVRHSLSAPHPPTLDPSSTAASSDPPSKYHCDLVARNGSDVYRYPSPLHAVAVQSPVFLQMLGHCRDEGFLKSVEADVEGLKPESAPLVPQSSSWPAPSPPSQTPSHKRLDGYIYSLLQRRALPVRTSRPRTSISTDRSRSILKQASLCVRQVSGPCFGTLRGSELKPSWPASVESAATSSPLRQWSPEGKPEEQDSENGTLKMNTDQTKNQNSCPVIQSGSSVTNAAPSSNSLLKKKSKRLLPPSAGTLPKDVRELGSPKDYSPPKETAQPCHPPDQDLLLKSSPLVKTQTATPKSSPKPLQTGPTDKADSSQSHEDKAGGEGGGSHTVNARFSPPQRHDAKARKGGGKNIKVKTRTPKTSRTSEHHESERRGDKTHRRSGSKKSRLLEDGGPVHVKASRRGAHGGSSSRVKRLPASIPEGRVLDKHVTSAVSSVRSGSSGRHHHGNHHHSSSNHHHHHQWREQVAVVAKPKYKRNSYRRLRAIMEVPYDEAFRRAHRKQRGELPSRSEADAFPRSDGPLSSPYAYTAGSDSEYSAECASLFHSTIVDTSEDDRSNYTANRFGDSESSEEEDVEESSATSDTEESGGGGAGGRGRSQGGAGQEGTQPKAFVKIKASHNLKKKILRFRSGSLKLMTTV